MAASRSGSTAGASYVSLPVMPHMYESGRQRLCRRFGARRTPSEQLEIQRLEAAHHAIEGEARLDGLARGPSQCRRALGMLDELAPRRGHGRGIVDRNEEPVAAIRDELGN